MQRDSQIELYNDFMEAYDRTVKSLGKMACLVEKSELIKLTINSQAPRYYISPDRARAIVIKYNSEGKVNSCYECNNRMINEFIEKYKENAKSNPNKSMSSIVEEIVYSSASSFFISRTKAYEILHKYYAKGGRNN